MVLNFFCFAALIWLVRARSDVDQQSGLENRLDTQPENDSRRYFQSNERYQVLNDNYHDRNIKRLIEQAKGELAEILAIPNKYYKEKLLEKWLHRCKEEGLLHVKKNEEGGNVQEWVGEEHYYEMPHVSTSGPKPASQFWIYNMGQSNKWREHNKNSYWIKQDNINEYNLDRESNSNYYGDHFSHKDKIDAVTTPEKDYVFNMIQKQYADKRNGIQSDVTPYKELNPKQNYQTVDETIGYPTNDFQPIFQNPLLSSYTYQSPELERAPDEENIKQDQITRNSVKSYDYDYFNTNYNDVADTVVTGDEIQEYPETDFIFWPKKMPALESPKMWIRRLEISLKNLQPSVPHGPNVLDPKWDEYEVICESLAFAPVEDHFWDRSYSHGIHQFVPKSTFINTKPIQRIEFDQPYDLSSLSVKPLPLKPTPFKPILKPISIKERQKLPLVVSDLNCENVEHTLRDLWIRLLPYLELDTHDQPSAQILSRLFSIIHYYLYLNEHIDLTQLSIHDIVLLIAKEIKNDISNGNSFDEISQSIQMDASDFDSSNQYWTDFKSGLGKDIDVPRREAPLDLIDAETNTEFDENQNVFLILLKEVIRRLRLDKNYSSEMLNEIISNLIAGLFLKNYGKFTNCEIKAHNRLVLTLKESLQKYLDLTDCEETNSGEHYLKPLSNYIY